MKAYKKLVEKYERIHHLSHMQSIVYWDQQSMMPSGSSDARAKAMAEFGVIIHEASVDKEIALLLNDAMGENLNAIQKASLREMQKTYTSNTILPSDLVKAQSLAHSKCNHTWIEQRANNNWKGFEPRLNEVIKLSKEEARIRSEINGLSAYDSLLDLFEPGMKSQTLDGIFADVKTWLPELIQNIVEKQKSQTFIKPQGIFKIKAQKELGVKVMKHLGFDFNKGRIDISAHPFCGGVPEDVRLTTRYDENDFVQSLMGTIHETGHALYEQNLPQDLLALPVGQARSMGIHESQSLFFEMQMGRSGEFLKSIHPYIIESFGNDEALALDNLVKIYSKVEPSLIRVDADEVTYASHVILRYEIEKALINGQIQTSDIPDMWNDKMQEALGLNTKDNYKNACMQDVHWSEGLFGYFPSYTLGAMYAAQQFNTVKKVHPNINDSIANGDLSQIKSWLKENIWSNASIYSTDELMSKATGESLNPKYFKEHLENRYLFN
ncbi:carboxypeptidase M32 [Poseidonibacter parvus]|uniref:Metal-dependent carboxypeptidase n=1 Tax=Poseidonibacter parvus TaxID=1850254 RepID=A0A1P8KM60_9BACT|nr:carboxypeptidase M32 [Poseidonibacter parvus]APW65644.1 carboxypeptidase M32 [Poseidonibacter parvus]